ncbi:uncharacterized protein A1O5_09584 [Cladophialophora psammophila CBS 110553]|uniref:Major facilitator superfamily (MFS) profile domain-containing protein n=1 Tax=Cladophialophora psammophila CBS 110553 TaxID=1182543 RepID=W9WSD4_9EURO|nr:uncharacterized protein A1O5_09584 [Cladophialophora psammophila CBS 110553]EXJ67571.1 hypothetical protein A1O5_09584 [Cladophialophora psammophila CBS 110553]
MAEQTSTIATAPKMGFWKRNWKVCVYCFIASFAATAFGFDQGTGGGFLAMQQWLKDFGYYDSEEGVYSITAGSTTAMNGTLCGSAFLAALASGRIGSQFGRKIGLILCGAAGLIGSGISMIPHYGALIVGKVFIGISMGFAGNFAITYWSETAPAQIRGLIVIMYQFNINLPNFIGACVDQGTYLRTDRWSYRIPLFVTMFPPLVLVTLVWLIPESPRWLVTRDKYSEARTSLVKIRGKYARDDELDAEMKEVIAFTELERSLDASTSYRECFSGTNRRRTLIGMLCMGGQHMQGIAFISGYSTYFFSLIGFNDAFVITVIINACQVAAVIFAFIAVRFIGRRILLIVGAGVCAASMFLFAIVAQAAPGSDAANKCIVAFICIYVFSFAATWGSIGPIVTGEVPSNRLRSKTVSCALSTNWFGALLVITSIPYLINKDYANLGTKVGFIFGPLATIVFVLAIFFLPETKDRSLEEIDEMFINRVSTRKFKSYICTKEAAGVDIMGKAGVIEVEDVKKV